MARLHWLFQLKAIIMARSYGLHRQIFWMIYNAYSSGANVDLAMNGLSSLIGENKAITIRSKSLDYNYLTISDSTASMLKIIMIGVFPIIYLAIGICVVLHRRRMQNETV